LKSFKYSKKNFHISIDKNSFSLDKVSIDLPDVKANFSIYDKACWKTNLISPSAMGYYHYFPFMENYHGINLMNGFCNGIINNSSFNEAKLYIEKDYGVSQPNSWIWMQANNFANSNISLTFSYANVPFLKKAFNGFICGLLINKKLYKFTTYNSSKIIFAEENEDSIKVIVVRNNKKLILNAKKSDKTELLSPVYGEMKKTIYESVSSKISVEMYEKNKLIFEGASPNGGLEYVNTDNLLVYDY